jgi:predicted deacetylase
MRKFPFFIVVDDGGHPQVGLKGERDDIGISVYRTILKLAGEFQLRIPICFTMKYLDKENSSGFAEPLSYLDELIALLTENQNLIEIGYHGLTHEYDNHPGEFYCMDLHRPVPPSVQEQHLEMSAEIFSHLGIDFPELFVPPYHAWEQGVTDRLTAQFGVKYLVSFPRLSFEGRVYSWSPSRFLHFLHREDLGIYSYHKRLNDDHLKTAQKLALPRKMIDRLRLRRTFFDTRIHSYMVHIGNFFPENYPFWKKLLKWVKDHPRMELCEDNRTAVSLFLSKGFPK